MIIKNKQWRLVEIDPLIILREYGLWQLFWGTDIFIGKLPFMKLLVLANIVVWVVTT